MSALKACSLVLCIALLLAGCAGQQPSSTTTTPTTTTAAQVSPLPAADWSKQVLYFAIVDRFADGDPSNNVNVDRSAKGTFHGGDLNGLIQHLDEIAELGVTALWITPVVDNIDGFVTGAGFPDWGYHGYWADDFTEMDHRFGTEEELRKLVEEAHKRDIRVLLDVVYNHAGYNSDYTRDPRTQAWLRTEDRGTCGTDDLTQCIAGLPDFKTENPEVADYLLNAHINRAKEVGLDGFRLDTVKHIDHPFWQEHRTRTRNLLGQHFFLLGEVWGGDPQVLEPWFSGDEMDAGFDFSFQGSVLSFCQGRGRTVAFDKYLKSREKVRAGYLLSHFLSSHDVPGALYQLNGDVQLFRLAAILQFTSIGIPMIYYGEEVGRPGGDWPENRSDMPWGDRPIQPGAGKPRNEELRADYMKLIAIRRNHPSLSNGIHTPLSTEGDLLVFQQEDAKSGDTVIVAINRGSQPATAAIKTPASWSTAIYDIWNDEAVAVKDSMIEMTVPSKSARILASTPLKNATPSADSSPEAAKN